MESKEAMLSALTISLSVLELIKEELREYQRYLPSAGTSEWATMCSDQEYSTVVLSLRPTVDALFTDMARFNRLMDCTLKLVLSENPKTINEVVDELTAATASAYTNLVAFHSVLEPTQQRDLELFGRAPAGV
jgi:hypothetical protein